MSLLPEEKVRSDWIERMIQSGYPRALLVIEKEIALLPHLVDVLSHEIPKRRIDLLVYAKQGDRYLPLLMIECKAVKLHESHAEQLIGYNHYVRAPYIAIANEHQFLIAHERELIFKEGLPHYDSLFPLIHSNE